MTCKLASPAAPLRRWGQMQCSSKSCIYRKHELRRHHAVAWASRKESTTSTQLLDKPSAPDSASAGPSNAGIATLATVSFLWGTFAPVVRFLYQQDATLSPAFLTGVRGTLSASALLLAGSLSKATTQAGSRAGSPETHDARAGLLLAGLELGVWNFLGTSCQATGLELTTATKAAFLIQLTGVMTPCLAYLLGESIPGTVWRACLLALLGSCMIACDELDPQQVMEAAHGVLGSLWAGASDAAVLAPSATADAAAAVAAGAAGPAVAAATAAAGERSSGDAVVVLSCLFYSMCTVRLSKYAPKYDAVQLAGTKLLFFGLLSVVWLVAEESLHLTDRPGALADAASSLQVVSASSSSEAWSIGWAQHLAPSAWLPAGLSNPLAISVLVYSALGPGALGSLLQTKGQAEVPAAQAQVIFSLTPVWSALLASAFLPGESMGLLAWLGAVVIIAASVWVAAAEASVSRKKLAAAE